ncbi:uncharacterized protein Tco025E_00818 [Trypanosoma conorhini]|uniref:Uncharacterized protein n=1 Tax=Trypanosoma conorhini TaxID=83891 RepID=A0A3S5IUN5_9TRYP|nr:uncharacterized protein Tco025E_00818 [Trypanosoma conorhini]RNF26952.1 hypothetical protein Tco025E_00818 [Trypanosoma conorhini]
MSLPKHRQTVPLPELVPPNRAATMAAAAAAAAPTRATPQEAEAAVGTDAKIERHRYAKLLLHHVQRYHQFTSVELFVEAVLRDVALQEGVTPQARAAAASWAMRLLCGGVPSRRRVMEALVEALFPAIYRDYDEKRLDYAPPAIQVLVNDRALLRDNPFFSHSMYMQDLVVANATTATLSGRLRRTLPTILRWKKFVFALVGYIQHEIKRRSFLAWRGFAKRSRAENLLRRNVIVRHEQKILSLRLQAAFFRWKAAVESSRTEYLTERLHQAAFQLESAKNQFQLQCLRADKLQLSYEAGQADLLTVMQGRDELRREVEELNETLALREKEHQERIRARVSEVVALVQQQRCVLRKAIDARLRVAELTADWLDEALQEAKPKTLDAAAAAAEDAFPPGYKFLLKWCNHVYCVQQAKRPLRVSNFAADFSNGDAYLLLLLYVFAEERVTTIVPPPPPTRLSGIAKYERLVRVCEYAASTPLAIVLAPEDFGYMREDKIAAAVAEIFLFHVRETRVMYTNEARRIVGGVAARYEPGANNCTPATAPAPAAAAASGGDGADADAGVAAGTGVTEEEGLQLKVLGWKSELERWAEELHANVLQEQKFQRCDVAIASEADHILRERAQGQPVYVVTSNTGLMFTNVSAKNTEDLRARVKTPTSQAWKTFLRTALRGVLWRHIRLIAAHFYHFAGADSRKMGEVQFWRFAEETRLTAEPFSPLLVMQIFDIVASPQLAALWRSGAKDERRENLLEAAQEEIEIRSVKPAQFTEILVRLAMTQYKGGIVEATDRFLSGLQLPVLENVLPVTSSFYGLDPQRVVTYFQHDLARVFFFYVNRQMLGSLRRRSRSVHGCGRFMARLSHTMYLKMFVDCDFILPEQEIGSGSAGYQRKTRFMSAEEVLKMLEVVQTRIPSLPAGELCFSLFLETFGVTCVYWWPDPVVPLSRKLGAFLADMMDKLRAVFLRDTLVLGPTPFIPLEGGAHVELF